MKIAKNCQLLSRYPFLSLILFLATFLSQPITARAGEVGIEYTVGIEPVSFQSFKQGETLGFIDQPLWFQLDLSSFQTLESHVLLVRPIHIDRIQFYRNSDIQNVLQLSGDTVESPKSLISDGYTYLLDDSWNNEKLLIRIETKNVVQPFFQVQSIEATIQSSKLLMLSIGMITAITLACLAWALSTVITMPTILAPVFSVRLILFILTVGIHSGVIRDVMSPGMLPPQDYAHNFMALTYITVAHLFDWLLLRSVVREWAARIFLAVILIFSVTKFALIFSDGVSTALLLNNASALLVLLLGSCFALGSLVSSVRDKKEACLVAAYFIVQFVPLAALLILTILESAQYLSVFQLMFFSYSIVPGGIVVLILYCRQKAYKKSALMAQRRAEEMTIKSEEELAKRQAIGDLMNMLTHEIRTPLARLQMAAALDDIDKKLVNDSARSIADILRQADRAEDFDIGQLQLVWDSVSLRDSFVEAGRNLGADVVCTKDIDFVRADVALLRIVVNNIMTNAQKYGVPGQSINVDLSQGPKTAMVEISNQIKHHPGDLDGLFKKYKRGNNSGGQPGSGLGLYMARELCNKMGISLDVLLDGSTFIIRLEIPLDEPSVEPGVGA